MLGALNCFIVVVKGLSSRRSKMLSQILSDFGIAKVHKDPASEPLGPPLLGLYQH